ncbi:hypothetical protein G5B00_05555 [Parapedobacter sp. SGR-10]|uniref:hypothetical protein n=1 Tax=Parapedobacter sp. SGR-10 TaxID=2710879 RepID=UPI0013D86A88|nr:hypothetical protein [Parapedobacter sp. SGR-10]NGF55976.1 hypothetical protein [Parapedobacter sp. SGR-10]
MKKSTTLFLASGMLLCTVCSCSKKNSPQPEIEPVEVLRLTAFTVDYEDNNSHYNEETRFHYNSDHFLSSYQTGEDIREMRYDEQGRIIQNGNMTYTYNDRGQIAQIDEDPGEDYLGNYSEIKSTYTYNNKELPTESTVVITGRDGSYTTTVTRQFAYDEDDRLISIVEHRPGGGTNYRTALRYDTNDNIAEIKRESSNDPTFPEDNTQTYIHTYTYDYKQNPRYVYLQRMGVDMRLSLVYTIPMGLTQPLESNTFHRVNYCTPNNILSSVTTLSTGMVSSTYTFAYEYNEEGYPVSAERTETSGPSYMRKRYYSWDYEVSMTNGQ